MGQYYQGKYKLENPKKYSGDPNSATYRSSWELVAFRFCDLNPKVLQWHSEETIIPYISPIDGRMHRYFMDLKIWTKNSEGKIVVTLIEIKPDAETRPPEKKQGKRKDVFMREVATYVVNQAKWKAARELCEREGWNFVIWTEKQLKPESAASVQEMKAQRTYEDKMKKAFRKKAAPKIEMMKKIIAEKIKEKL